MTMKKIITLLLFLFVISCSSQNTDEQKSLITDFKQAQQKGNLEKMDSIVKKMSEKKIITKGMFLKTFIKTMGTPNHSTGIYIPGGISYGYGNTVGNAQNYPLFYWFHFRADNWDKENPKDEEEKLVSWGDS